MDDLLYAGVSSSNESAYGADHYKDIFHYSPIAEILFPKSD